MNGLVDTELFTTKAKLHLYVENTQVGLFSSQIGPYPHTQLLETGRTIVYISLQHSCVYLGNGMLLASTHLACKRFEAKLWRITHMLWTEIFDGFGPQQSHGRLQFRLQDCKTCQHYILH